VTRWDHARAAIILLALVAHGAHALPLPPRVTEHTLKEDWRQRDIRLWRGWLADAGIEVRHEAIEEQLLFWTNLTGTLHQTLKAPFRPLFRVTASDQSWALFAAASRRPERLVVEIREDDDSAWRVISRRLDPCCNWMDEVIRYRRVRGVWDGQKKHSRRTYRNLSQWLADRAFEDFPEAQQVRVKLEQRYSPYPWEDPDDEVKIRHARPHQRGYPRDPGDY